MAKYEYIHKDNFWVDLQVQVPISIAVEWNTITEQEIVKPYLDKIRAEIESIEHYGTNNGTDFWLRTPDEIKKDVLIILDKYKAELEETDD